MANPWDNDPIVQHAGATAAPDASAPWNNDPIIQKAGATAPDTRPPNMFREIGQDIGNRFTQEKANYESSNTNPNVLATMAGAVGPVFGAMGDVAADIGKAAYRALPDTPALPGLNGQGIKGAISSQARAFASSPAGKAALLAAQQGAEAYGVFAKAHPDIAKIADAGMNIASVLPATKVAKAALGPKVLEDEVIKSAAAKTVRGINRGIEGIKDTATFFDTAVGKALSGRLDTVLDMANPSDVNASKGAAEAIQRIKANLERGDTNLKNLITERTDLSKAMASDTNYKAAAGARDAIDDIIEHLAKNPDKISAGNPAAAKEFQTLLGQVREAKTYQSVTDALAKGKGSSSKIRAQMAKLADNDRKMSFLPAEVQSRVRALARGKDSGAIMRGAEAIQRYLPKGAKMVLPDIEDIAGATADKATRKQALGLLENLRPGSTTTPRPQPTSADMMSFLAGASGRNATNTGE